MRYIAVCIVVLIFAAAGAWLFRYQQIMGSNGPALWDRWAQRECDIQSVSNGYGCNFDNTAGKALVAADQHQTRLAKSKAAAVEIHKAFPDATQMSGLPGIEAFRAAGFNEKEIADWVAPQREKLLAAGIAKSVVDDYFGGDPFASKE